MKGEMFMDLKLLGQLFLFAHSTDTKRNTFASSSLRSLVDLPTQPIIRKKRKQSMT